MAEIQLTNGGTATVDDSDYEWLIQWNWYRNGVGYASRKELGKSIMMHRQINGTPEGLDTDHINRDRLDNRRANLRSVTRSENHLNRGRSRLNKSGVTGVYWHVGTNKWEASIQFRGVRKRLGSFTDLEDARRAREIAECQI